MREVGHQTCSSKFSILMVREEGQFDTLLGTIFGAVMREVGKKENTLPSNLRMPKMCIGSKIVECFFYVWQTVE